MPSTLKPLISLRGGREYENYLKRLLRAAKARGVDLRGSAHALAEHALAELGRSWGVDPVRRAPPPGTNRFGEPRKNPEKIPE